MPIALGPSMLAGMPTPIGMLTSGRPMNWAAANWGLAATADGDVWF